VHDASAENCLYRGTKWFNYGRTAWAESSQASACLKSRKSAAIAAGKLPAYIDKIEKGNRIPSGHADQEKAIPRGTSSLSLVQNMQLRERALPNYLREGSLHLTTLFPVPLQPFSTPVLSRITSCPRFWPSGFVPIQLEIRVEKGI
jgi:hypothetical protein